MYKIVVIGANGYIGRNLVHHIRASVDNVELKLYGKEAKHFDNESNYYQIDMCDEKLVREIDLDCDLIYMLVGKTGTLEGFKDPISFLDSNEKTLLLLLKEYILQKSHAKLIFSSTRLLYHDALMAKESEISCNLNSIYAICKLACEKYIELFHRIYDIQYIIFRICIPYGTMIEDASSYGTVDFMVRSAKDKGIIYLYGDGTVKRTFTHISDLTRIMLECGIMKKCRNSVYNIGGEVISLENAAELVAEKYGAQTSYIPYPDLALMTESGDTCFDDGKIRNDAGINYFHKFEDWIKG